MVVKHTPVIFIIIRASQRWKLGHIRVHKVGHSQLKGEKGGIGKSPSLKSHMSGPFTIPASPMPLGGISSLLRKWFSHLIVSS